MQLAVDLPGDHLRLADGQFEALAAHLLDENGQCQLTTALHLPGVGAADVDDLHGHVADEFRIQAGLHHPRGQLVSRHLARQR
ncbi:Uncharacterised protein [Mycobacteroides abscessus subsp. abscessus]|nr:Uncharacterised protein [Mycobacteroides abscessus subsp. abscessus]